MGINGIWPLIGEPEITSIAHFASKHFMSTGRPLRIVIDEATWRYHMASEERVVFIRSTQKDEGCYNPEKILLQRIIRLQALGIEIIFVFDGPDRPELKRNKKSSPVPWKKIALWKDILDKLNVPYHHAPGEAEAECARLQALDIVDAVWSEDSDCFMFGCAPKASTTHIRVYRLENCGLDRDGFALFATLCGGDYDTLGLYGCGRVLAHEAIKHGLHKKLCVEGYHQPRFRAHLIQFLRGQGANLMPDKDFPTESVRKAYLHPKVSSDERLKELHPRLMNPVNHEDIVHKLLLPKFNFWTQEYKTHIVPIMFLRVLAETSRHQEAHFIERLDIKLVKQTKKTATAEGTATTKISFLSAGICPMDGIPIKNPATYNERTELVTLKCILERYLPSLFSTDQQVTRGTKRKFNENKRVSLPETLSNSTKRGTKRKSTVKPTNTVSDPPVRVYSPPQSLHTPHYPSALDLSTPCSAGFRIPPMGDFGFPGGFDATPSRSSITAADASEDDDLKEAISLSLLDQELRSVKWPSATNFTFNSYDSPTTIHGFNGGVGIDRRQMEQERLARLNKKSNAAGSTFQTPLASASSNTNMATTKNTTRVTKRVEIDLTGIDD